MSTEAVKVLHTTPGKVWMNSNNNQLRYNDDASGTPNWVIPLSVFKVGQSLQNKPYIKRGMPVSIGSYDDLDEESKVSSDPRVVLTNSLRHEWCSGIALEPGDSKYFNDEDNAILSYENIHVQSSGHITYRLSDDQRTCYIPPHNDLQFLWQYSDVGKAVYISNLEGHEGEFTLDLSEATYNGGKVLTVGRIVDAPLSASSKQEITIDIILDGDTRGVVEATTFEVLMGYYDESIYKCEEAFLQGIASQNDRIFCIKIINNKGYFIVNDEMLTANKNHTPVGAVSLPSNGNAIDLTQYFGKTIQVTRLGILKAERTYGYASGNIGQELYLNNGEITPSSPSAVYEYRVGVVYSRTQILVDCRFPKTDLQKFDRVGDIKPIYVTEANGVKNYSIEPGYVMVESGTIHKVSGAYEGDTGNPYTDFSYFIKTIFDKDIVLFTKDKNDDGTPLATATWHRKGEAGYKTFEDVKNAFFKFKDLWYTATNVDGSATSKIKTQIKYTAEASPEQMTYLWPEIAEQVTMLPPADSLSDSTEKFFIGRKAGEAIKATDFTLDITGLAEANEYFDENGSSLDAYDIFLYDDKKTLITPGFYTFTFNNKEVWAGFNWEIEKVGKNVRLNMVTNPGVDNCLGFCWPVGSPLTTQKVFNVVIRKRPTQFLGISLNQLYATSPLHKHTTGSNLITQTALFFGTPKAVSGSEEGQPSYYLGQDTVSAITVSNSNIDSKKAKYLNYFLSAFKNDDGTYSSTNKIIQRFYALGGPNNSYKAITINYDFDSNVVDMDAYFAPKILASSTETKIGEETNIIKSGSYSHSAIRALSKMPTSLFVYANDNFTNGRQRLSAIQDDIVALYRNKSNIQENIYDEKYTFDADTLNMKFKYSDTEWNNIFEDIGNVLGVISDDGTTFTGGNYLCYQSNLGLLNAAIKETSNRLLAIERALFGFDYDTITSGTDAPSSDRTSFGDVVGSITNAGAVRDISAIEDAGLVKFDKSSDIAYSDYAAIFEELYGDYETEADWEAIVKATEAANNLKTENIMSKGVLHKFYFSMEPFRKRYPSYNYPTPEAVEFNGIRRAIYGDLTLLLKPSVGLPIDADYTSNVEALALEESKIDENIFEGNLRPYTFDMGYDDHWQGISPNESYENNVIGYSASKAGVGIPQQSLEGYICDLTLKLSSLRKAFDSKRKVNPFMSALDFDYYAFSNLGDNTRYVEAAPIAKGPNPNEYYSVLSFSKDYRINRVGKLFLNKNTRTSVIYSNIKKQDGSYPAQAELRDKINYTIPENVLTQRKTDIKNAIIEKYLTSGFDKVYSLAKISTFYNDETTNRVADYPDEFIEVTGIDLATAEFGVQEIIDLYSQAEENDATKIVACYAAKVFIGSLGLTAEQYNSLLSFDIRTSETTIDGKYNLLKKFADAGALFFANTKTSIATVDNEISAAQSKVYSYGPNRGLANQAYAEISDEPPIATLDYGDANPGTFTGTNINNYTRLNMVPVSKSEEEFTGLDVTRMHTNLGWMPDVSEDEELGVTNTVQYRSLEFRGDSTCNPYNESTEFLEYAILKKQIVDLQTIEATVTVQETIEYDWTYDESKIEIINDNGYKDTLNSKTYNTSKLPKDSTNDLASTIKEYSQQSYSFIFNLRENSVAYTDVVTSLKGNATLFEYDDDCLSPFVAKLSKSLFTKGSILRVFKVKNDDYAVRFTLILCHNEDDEDTDFTKISFAVKTEVFRLINAAHETEVDTKTVTGTLMPNGRHEAINITGTKTTTTYSSTVEQSYLVYTKTCSSEDLVADGPVKPKQNYIELDAEKMFEKTRVTLSSETPIILSTNSQYTLAEKPPLTNVVITKTVSRIGAAAEKNEVVQAILTYTKSIFENVFANTDINGSSIWRNKVFTGIDGYCFENDSLVTCRYFWKGSSDTDINKVSYTTVKLTDDFKTEASLLFKDFVNRKTLVEFTEPQLVFSDGSQNVYVNEHQNSFEFNEYDESNTEYTNFVSHYNLFIESLTNDFETIDDWDSSNQKSKYALSIIYSFIQLYKLTESITSDRSLTTQTQRACVLNNTSFVITSTYDFKENTYSLDYTVPNLPRLDITHLEGSIPTFNGTDSLVLMNKTNDEGKAKLSLLAVRNSSEGPVSEEMSNIEVHYDGVSKELSWAFIEYLKEQSIRFKKFCLENDYYQTPDKQSVIIRKELVEEYNDPDEFNAIQLTPLIQGFKLCRDQVPNKIDFALEMTSDNIRDLVKLDVAQELDSSEDYSLIKKSTRSVPSFTGSFTISSSTTTHNLSSKNVPASVQISDEVAILSRPAGYEAVHCEYALMLSIDSIIKVYYSDKPVFTIENGSYVDKAWAACLPLGYGKSILSSFEGYVVENTNNTEVSHPFYDALYNKTSDAPYIPRVSFTRMASSVTVPAYSKDSTTTKSVAVQDVTFAGYRS